MCFGVKITSQILLHCYIYPTALPVGSYISQNAFQSLRTANYKKPSMLSPEGLLLMLLINVAILHLNVEISLSHLDN